MYNIILSRRQILMTAALSSFIVPLAVAQTTATALTFTLPPLPYAFDALEPAIDKMTMEIHHGKHHQAYINNLNAQVATYADLKTLTLPAIMAKMSSYNVAVRNNGGGHFNHDFFWPIMAPVGTGGAPSAALMTAINRDFTSLKNMEEEFEKAAGARFGSGWAWLIVTADKKLAITSTANQDNPLMDVVEVRGTPILGLDVWEHAYYLHYQNRRADYMKAWWSIVNWNRVNELYSEAIK